MPELFVLPIRILKYERAAQRVGGAMLPIIVIQETGREVFRHVRAGAPPREHPQVAEFRREDLAVMIKALLKSGLPQLSIDLVVRVRVPAAERDAQGERGIERKIRLVGNADLESIGADIVAVIIPADDGGIDPVLEVRAQLADKAQPKEQRIFLVFEAIILLEDVGVKL
jgi:hypothetical protein